MNEWNGIKVGGLYLRTGLYASQLRAPIMVTSIELTSPQNRVKYCECGKGCDSGEWVDVHILAPPPEGGCTIQLRMTVKGVEWAGRSLASQEGSEEPTAAWPYEEVA